MHYCCVGSTLVELDLLRREARIDGRATRLSGREFQLLAHLLRRRPALVTRQELLREVCRQRIDPGTNVVEVHMSRLRAKLRAVERPWLIETVRGRGYRLAQGPVPAF